MIFRAKRMNKNFSLFRSMPLVPLFLSILEDFWSDELLAKMLRSILAYKFKWLLRRVRLMIYHWSLNWGGTLPETNIAMENPPLWWYLPGFRWGFSWAILPVSFRKGNSKFAWNVGPSLLERQESIYTFTWDSTGVVTGRPRAPPQYIR